MPELKKEGVLEGFAKPGLEVRIDKGELQQWLSHLDYSHVTLY